MDQIRDRCRLARAHRVVDEDHVPRRELAFERRICERRSNRLGLPKAALRHRLLEYVGEHRGGLVRARDAAGQAPLQIGPDEAHAAQADAETPLVPSELRLRAEGF
jgi:hypothetical protein